MLLVLSNRRQLSVIGGIGRGVKDEGRFQLLELGEKDEFILFYKIVVVHKGERGKELHNFCPPNNSNDLCLFFCPFPSSVCIVLYICGVFSRQFELPLVWRAGGGEQLPPAPHLHGGLLLLLLLQGLPQHHGHLPGSPPPQAPHHPAPRPAGELQQLPAKQLKEFSIKGQSLPPCAPQILLSFLLTVQFQPQIQCQSAI